MNLAILAPNWLIAILLPVLIGAALEDAWRLRISNAFPILLIAGAIVAAVLAGPTLALWQNVLLFVGLLVVGTFLFGAGMLGGGDVKLFAACGLWFDWPAGWKMLVAVAIAGGLLAILLLSIRPVIAPRWRTWIVLQSKGGIPYGVAIVIGTITLGALLR